MVMRLCGTARGPKQLRFLASGIFLEWLPASPIGRYHCELANLGELSPRYSLVASLSCGFAIHLCSTLSFVPCLLVSKHLDQNKMPNNWVPLHRYSIIPTTEDGETSTTPNVALAGWLKSKRIRTSIGLALLLVVIALSIRTFGLPYRFKDAISPHQDEPKSPAPGEDSTVRWSEFAYVQYVTNTNYLCNSVMILEAQYTLGVKADRLMMYPSEWDVPEDDGSAANLQGRLLAQARDRYATKLVPVEIQKLSQGEMTWAESVTKLLAFNQTQYRRVISLDSDATVRQVSLTTYQTGIIAHTYQSMDELFLLPSSPVAMPRAYWLDQPFLSSQMIVIEPSAQGWANIERYIHSKKDPGFDMDILNALYKNSSTIIPHRKYNLITGEFRSDTHERYLGTSAQLNGTAMLEEAKFIHFSDWPRPKPWIKATEQEVQDIQPKCKNTEREQDCSDRQAWLSIY